MAGGPLVAHGGVLPVGGCCSHSPVLGPISQGPPDPIGQTRSQAPDGRLGPGGVTGAPALRGPSEPGMGELTAQLHPVRQGLQAPRFTDEKREVPRPHERPDPTATARAHPGGGSSSLAHSLTATSKPRERWSREVWG